MYPHTHTHMHTYTTSTGKNTAEYKTVSTHLEYITKTLKSHEVAFDCLTQKVKAKGWLPPYSKPSEDDLVYIIINRIELEASQFGEFTDMLHNTEGMDLVARRLKSEY